MELIIRPTVIKGLITNIKQQFPQEFCAFLYGQSTENKVILEELFPVKNYAKSGRFFVLKKEDVLQSKHHLAFFHSHNRGNLELSRLDRKNYRFIANYWILGRILDEKLLLKAYNPFYENINIKRKS
ncbi:hypothetical protein ACJD0Z_09370 [Flavobacteriaceae bacterium M23B6Z8]